MSSSEPLFFWREFEEPYGFLSQWYESAFEVDGVTYETAEMWMMIQKAKLFGDEVGFLAPRRFFNVCGFELIRGCLCVGDCKEDDADDCAGGTSSAGEEGEGIQSREVG